MGGALLGGWLASGLKNLAAVEPAGLPEEAGVLIVKTLDDLGASFQPDAIVLAVKPQSMAAAVPLYVRFKRSLFLSIAAGLTLHKLGALLGLANAALVRAMPNLPASVGQGMSVAVANGNVTASQRALAEKLLSAVGTVAWVEDEALMDPATALSGSGPAYVFALVESMAAGGIALGLPEPLAQQLACKTLVGSAALLARSLDSPTTLRQAVTSPGGTTEAALRHMQDLPDMLRKAMHAAVQRARELG